MNSIVKRCLVGVILALAATLPNYQTLKASPAGLKLIADYEGCQLNAYQCSANVWTNGIGHTAGVKPGSVISERQVAVNLVADVQRVERALAVCMPVTMPQPVYDAVVSFAFNVGPALLAARRWRFLSTRVTGTAPVISCRAGSMSMA